MGLPLSSGEDSRAKSLERNMGTPIVFASFEARLPFVADACDSITQHGFKITTRKLPILKAEPIEKMTASLGITPPEMIFGDNMVSIEHSTSGFSITFNTYDALDRVDKTGNSMLQVAHSREWQSARYAGFQTRGILAHTK